MGRQPCCDKVGLRRGPWTIDEDNNLITFILNNGIHCWRTVPKLAGLLRCGKSCRLRWINYLRPDLKRGDFTEAEENQIIQLHSRLGNRWSKIASHFPGRTDNEIKNHWNTRLKKKLRSLGVDPLTHKPILQERATSDYKTPVLEANNNPQEIYDSLESKASIEETQEDVKLLIQQSQGKEDDGSFETKCAGQVHLTTNNNYNMLYGNDNISSSLISEVGLCQDTNNSNSTMMSQSYCFPANELLNSCYSGSVTEFRPINEDTDSSNCSLQQHWAAAVVDGNLNPMLSCDYWLQDDFFNF